MDERYQRGKIYTIRKYDDDNMIYVGSTIQTLSKRIGAHRTKSKNDKYKNRMLYQAVNANWDNWYIELFELYQCNSKEELERREGEVIREVGTLNKLIAGRTCKEYYENNKAEILEKRKVYYEDNKQKLLETFKIYREDNKQELLEKAKVYRDDNKEKILEQKKEYYENKKEKILEQRAEKVICQYCGCNISKGCLLRHQKTTKCTKAREST